jgi:crotonobetainyl-CoA:carnitine CoA-transferase CaiB-like acyl-CoA transferase
MADFTTGLYAAISILALLLACGRAQWGLNALSTCLASLKVVVQEKRPP